MSTPSIEPEDEDDIPAVPLIETAPSLLPDLSLLGIEEVDSGICEDTYENRKLLRANRYTWIQVFDSRGDTTSLIQGVSPEMVEARALTVLEDKRIILTDPKDLNSDYVSGLLLLVEKESTSLVPAWVIASTRFWVQVNKVRRETGTLYRPSLAGPPGRCSYVKANGIRCQFFHGGRTGENFLCRTHLSKTHTRRPNTTEAARNKLRHAAQAASDTLVEMMHEATSEVVRTKAATEILDRVGIRGGVEVDTNIKLDVKSHKDIVMDRLEALRKGAAAQERKEIEALAIEDADIVTDEDEEETDGHPSTD